MGYVEVLNIVDEKGSVLGTRTREAIHAFGLLHREVNIFFFTPDGDVIFQERSKTKDVHPGLLGITAAGHVRLGETFEEAALREVYEETGVRVSLEDLIPITQLHISDFDFETRHVNNSLRKVYAYRLVADPSTLRLEPGQADSFVVCPLERIFLLTEEERERFQQIFFREEYEKVLQKIGELIQEVSYIK